MRVEPLPQVESDEQPRSADRDARERDRDETRAHGRDDAERRREDVRIALLQPIDADHQHQRDEGLEHPGEGEGGDPARKAAPVARHEDAQP